jgi:hypothetical protein
MQGKWQAASVSLGPVSRRYVDGVEVREGVVVAGTSISAHTLFGRRVTTAARCLATKPDRWQALLQADGAVIWEGGEHDSEDAAFREAASHARQAVDRALREMFG